MNLKSIDLNLLVYLDVLLRTASAVAGPHLPRVLPVFTAHSKPEVCEDPDTRLAMMALLETTLSDAACAKHLGPFAKVSREDDDDDVVART